MMRPYKSELSKYVMMLSIQMGWKKKKSHESKFPIPQPRSYQPIQSRSRLAVEQTS